MGQRLNEELGIDERTRQDLIAKLAYQRAERRGFKGGDPKQDWLDAEVEVDCRLRQNKAMRMVHGYE
ncbi:MAG: DUF2934 domain-containing protein [Chromatiales bacterium]|jgi:hypothetical protein